MSANSLGRMVLDSTERHSGAAIRFPRDGTWHEWSFAELGNAVRELARGLVALGLEPGDRVALLGETRPEWTLADAALLAAGVVVVPVYHTNSPEECRYVVDHAGARAIIVENAAQLEKIEAVRGELPGLEHVVSMEPAGDTTTVADVRARAGEVEEAELQRRLDAIGADDVATIVYTSGTTGPPKGCMLTHRNVLFTGDAYIERADLRPPATLFMFLPLAHALARVVQMVSIQTGGTLAFWSGDPRRLVEDVGAAKPTHFPSVPRVFEKIHARVLARGEEGSAVKQRLFSWAIATGRKARPALRAGNASAALKAQYALADRLVLSKVRELFGGRLELALTGAAPIPGEVLEFLDACGITVLEGYGMTETCAAATLNPPDDPRFGTVGPRLAGTDVRIADDGEILLSGPNVFKGYHRNDEATREVFEGEAVRTGDLGELARRLPAHHRPQEGPDHHLERQEHLPHQHRERAARVALDLAGGRARRQPLVPGGAAHARRRRGSGPGRGAGNRRRRAGDGRPSAGTRGAPARRRPGQLALRPHRAGQEVHGARAGPQPGGRRADPDHEGQARGRRAALRRHVPRAVRRVGEGACSPPTSKRPTPTTRSPRWRSASGPNPSRRTGGRPSRSAPLRSTTTTCGRCAGSACPRTGSR